MLVRIGGLRSAKNFAKFFGRKAAERTSSNAFAVTGALSHACLVTEAKKALNLSAIRVRRPGLGQTGDWHFATFPAVACMSAVRGSPDIDEFEINRR
jgi:hypothetical protein